MKKILRQGNTKKYRTKCYVCDTEFEYQTSDLIMVKQFGMICVGCPHCNTLIEHKGNPSSNITTESI
jgi:hypothetical protein